MMDYLTDTEIIKLHRGLVAPMAVYQILKGHDSLDETALYALDIMLAEYQPDTALLCIALCAAHIAELHRGKIPLAESLGMEAGRIVHEFGPYWLANAEDRLPSSQENNVIDLLDRMAEDFEALSDLLGAVRVYLSDSTDSAQICDILAQNAQSFMDYLDYQAKEERMVAHHLMLKNLEVRGNVITFPKKN